MIQILKKAITICSLVVLGGAMLYNCEPDPDALGEQLFLGDAAQGKVDTLDIATFNINNNDQIRSDASKLGSLYQIRRVKKIIKKISQTCN